jgi:cyclopropane fatty-acyl-phospholipid synthase-like methyltransferase
MLTERKKSKFAAWQDQNPKGTFKQFYAEKLSKALAGKKRHSSIGPSLKKKGLQKTPGIFAKLVASGLKPSDVFVDFGCGTLRVGASLIEYLEPDRYVGFDIDQKILDVGRELLPPGVFEAKRPRLAVVSPQSLSEAAALHPRWVFSKGVLQHVPPDELDEFFQNLAAVMQPETVGVMRAQIGSKNEQISAKSWLHTTEDLQRASAAHGLDLSINQQEPLRHWLSLRVRRALAACLCFLTAWPMLDFDVGFGIAAVLS